ncbi:MAG: hypothetical protein ACUZ8H_02025 [Candidatus Anammoxibacter sp.]
MKSLLIPIALILLVFSFYVPYAEGMNSRIKGKMKKRPIHKTEYSPNRSNIDQHRTNKDLLNHKLHKEISAIPQNMIEELSVKARLNFYSGLEGKTQDPLVLFLNSTDPLPEGVGANYSALTNNDLSSVILRLIGLPINNGGSLSTMQVVSRIGLTAALWGNPIVGAVSSVVMSLAFNQIRNNDQYTYKQMKKNEDKIYKDIYKESSYDETGNSLSKGTGLNIENIVKMDFSNAELKNRLSMAIISQRALMMLASRLAGADVKIRLEQDDILMVNNTTQVQSPLIAHCLQHDLSIGNSNGFFVK